MTARCAKTECRQRPSQTALRKPKPGTGWAANNCRRVSATAARFGFSIMGTCRSTCAQSTDLEYYEAWRKEQPMRSSRRRATVVMDRSLRHQRSTRRHTKLWVCDRGCCSIRWKLDYAEFQSYMKYAEISPYVVEQTNHDGCVCVICRGLSDQFLQCRLNPTELRKASTTLSETDDEEDEPQENETSRSHVASPVA